ncbi:hypothetical protein AMS68_000383 [Peltaster fructicola]|uniref:Uncharacterized protein n=1 Tax=Peltaster fructicola TaxID=286661 RepID=A0A6H0XJH5_9PEZI|nr:hypothetical protein AMS68_000383 [Peltaster fructicola]
MDSMGRLSVSLPRTSQRRNESDTLSSFKAAALSVTNLYKAAAADSAQAREGGYQDALEDLLAYMDRDNLGMGDGEGWQVRKWVLERLEDAPSSKHTASEDDEDTVKHEEADTRASSPEAQRKGATQQLSTDLESTDRRTSSEPPVPQHASVMTVPSLDEFSFRTSAQLPHDKESQSMDMDPATPSTIRISKSSRPRHNRRDGRGNTSAINLTLASGTNGKRKFNYGDFFDIGNLNFDTTDKKDGSRGGKRIRHA